MRILMLDNEFPPLGGGTGIVNLHLLRGMSDAADVWVDLVTSSPGSRYETEKFAERIMLYKVPVRNRNVHHATNRELLTYTWRGFGLGLKLVRQHRYDLSFSFSSVPAGMISYLLRRVAGLPYLVSLQGPDVPGFEARYNSLYPFLKPALRLIWSRAEIATATSGGHQRLAARTTPALDIRVVPNGVDARRFQPLPAPRSSDRFEILCVGRLIERKGQHHLLRALAALLARTPACARLTLVGTGDAEPLLRAMAADLGLSNAVTFAGVVPTADMPAVYQRAGVFVLPSQNEGMSIALLEAMACALPVIVTHTGGTDELVRDGQGGYVVPWADVPALTGALARLLADPRLRCRMGAANRRMAERFSLESVTCQYLDLCRQVAAATSRN